MVGEGGRKGGREQGVRGRVGKGGREESMGMKIVREAVWRLEKLHTTIQRQTKVRTVLH